MKPSIFIFDPTASDSLSKVRGIGRYLQILKENFGKEWTFTNNLLIVQSSNNPTIFINPFFNFLQSPLVMKRVAKKQIAVIHDLIPLKYPQHFPIGVKGKINIYLNKLSLKNYNAIITDSEASKKDIINILRLPESIIHVVYPCLPKIFTNSKSKTLNPKQYQNSKSQTSTNFNQFQPISTNFCLYVGDATWNKNLVNLAKAIKIINVTCVFVGKVFGKSSSLPFEALAKNGWQKEYKEFLQEIKDDRRFILKGFVTDDELIKLYQQALVNILPSHDEGFGFSFLEAASQRCPSVLSDIPVLHEVSDDKALFFNPHDSHDIANKIGGLYFNRDAGQKLGKDALLRSQQFSANIFRQQLLKSIE